jgi:hypothetical protein
MTVEIQFRTNVEPNSFAVNSYKAIRTPETEKISQNYAKFPRFSVLLRLRILRHQAGILPCRRINPNEVEVFSPIDFRAPLLPFLRGTEFTYSTPL